MLPLPREDESARFVTCKPHSKWDVLSLHACIGRRHRSVSTIKEVSNRSTTTKSPLFGFRGCVVLVLRQANVAVPKSHSQGIVTTAEALQTRNLLSDTRYEQSIALNSELGNHVEVKTTVTTL
jgi:hypothetical protein